MFAVCTGIKLISMAHNKLTAAPSQTIKQSQPDLPAVHLAVPPHSQASTPFNITAPLVLGPSPTYIPTHTAAAAQHCLHCHQQCGYFSLLLQCWLAEQQHLDLS
jgi:hypothetical protein